MNSERDQISLVLQLLGELFKMARLRRGLSLRDAAMGFDLSEVELIAIEDGEAFIPMELTMRLCMAYGLQQDFEALGPHLGALVGSDELNAFLKARPTLRRLGVLSHGKAKEDQ